MLYFIGLNIVLLFILKNEKKLEFSCSGEVMDAKIQYLINEKSLLLKSSRFYIYIELFICIVILFFQNYAFYLTKKKNFKSLYIKTNII